MNKKIETEEILDFTDWNIWYPQYVNLLKNNNKEIKLTEIEDLIIPDKLEFLYNWTFKDSKKLKIIDLPENLIHIAEYSFSNSGLKRVKIPNSVTYMGFGVFMCCNLLEELTLSKNMSYIPLDIVRGCKSLKYFYIPKEIKDHFLNNNIEKRIDQIRSVQMINKNCEIIFI